MAFGNIFFISSHCTKNKSALFSIHRGVLLACVTSAAEFTNRILVPSNFLAKAIVGIHTPAPVVIIHVGRFIKTHINAGIALANKVHILFGWKFVKKTCSLSFINAFVDVVGNVNQ